MRFKELRGLGVALLLAILDGVLIGLSLHTQDRMKLIVALLLSFLIVCSMLFSCAGKDSDAPMKGVVLSSEDLLTLDWVALASQNGLNTLSVPIGFSQTEKGRDILSITSGTPCRACCRAICMLPISRFSGWTSMETGIPRPTAAYHPLRRST